MKVLARFNLSGWLREPGRDAEPLDLTLRVSADTHALVRRDLPIEGTLSARGFAEQASVSGQIGRRRLLLRFASDSDEALILRATARAFPEAPLLSLSVFDGQIALATGERRCDVQLRFDFRHDLPELFRSIRIRSTPSERAKTFRT